MSNLTACYSPLPYRLVARISANSSPLAAANAWLLAGDRRERAAEDHALAFSRVTSGSVPPSPHEPPAVSIRRPMLRAQDRLDGQIRGSFRSRKRQGGHREECTIGTFVSLGAAINVARLCV
jgi:hypothetical protein